ncbi:hypothetical protein BaRGS_00022821, partial [Batillaria attramentaria]
KRAQLSTALRVKRSTLPNVKQSGAVEACWAHNPEKRAQLSTALRVKRSTLTNVKQSGAVEACWAHNPEQKRAQLSTALRVKRSTLPNVKQSGAVEACWAHNPETFPEMSKSELDDTVRKLATVAKTTRKVASKRDDTAPQRAVSAE